MTVVVLSPPTVILASPVRIGATATTDGAWKGSPMASASPSVIGLGLRTFSPPPRKTKTMLVPMPWIESVMVASAPRPMETMAITAATPMTMPRMVRLERSLLEARLSRASRMAWRIFMLFPPPRHRGCG